MKQLWIRVQANEKWPLSYPFRAELFLDPGLPPVGAGGIGIDVEKVVADILTGGPEHEIIRQFEWEVTIEKVGR